MRYRATFLAGLAVGFVAGTRAGRERYEQMGSWPGRWWRARPCRRPPRPRARRPPSSTKVAKDKAATRVPKLTETAKNSASKVRGQLDRIPGRHAASQPESEHATVNGTRPAD